MGRQRYRWSVGTQKSHPLPHPRAISTKPHMVGLLMVGISSSGTASPYTISGRASSFTAFSKMGPATFSPSPTITQSIPSSFRILSSSSCQAPGPPTTIWGLNLLIAGWLNSSINLIFMYASPPSSWVKAEVAGAIPNGSISAIPTTPVFGPTTFSIWSGWATIKSSLRKP